MKKVSSLVLLLAMSGLKSPAQNKVPVTSIFANAEKQYTLMLKEHPDTKKFPFTLNPDGSLKDSDSAWWTSGFFPGTLWYIYEFSKAGFWKKNAEKWTNAMSKEQFNTSTHDLGFMLFCSYGNGYRLTGNDSYRKALYQGAESLSSRFNPKVGLIKSWDQFPPEGEIRYTYPVIIDNMMNLEFLMWVSKKSQNTALANIAISHADKTLKNHFRKDNSCYHAVCYSDKGEPLAKKTWQGYSDESAWARGQAWALYGYTMMYRETRKPEYLQQAENVASYYLNHPNLPQDKIPYWDFNAPGIPKEERDVSAAAVVASALLELSGYSKTNENLYFTAAETILKNLSTEKYTYKQGEGHGFILKHSVGFKPKGNEIDVPLNYADYYYLEALLRYKNHK